MFHGPMIFFALALALAGSFEACEAGKSSEKEYPLETYAKNYETINDYLTKKVYSDDLGNNFADAKEWLEKERSKLSIRRHRSLEKALERFLTLSRELTSIHVCASLFEAIKDNGEVLRNEERISNVNYPMRRMDRIIEMVADNYLESCQYSPRSNTEFEFSFKMRSYDHINLLLLEREPSTKDPEVNMDRVDELQKEIAEGALKEALGLLSSLRMVTEDRVCDRKGFMVVLKNLAASRQIIEIRRKRKEIDDSMRRIDRLVLHYAYIYLDSCFDLFPEQFTALIKKVDSVTLHRLRLLMSELSIGHHEHTEVAEAQFQSEFTTPELAEFTMTKAKATFSWGLNMNASGKDLRRYLKELAAPEDSDVRYLETFVDEVRGEKCVDVAKIANLYEKYIVVPCRNYLETTRKFFERFQYHIYQSTKGDTQIQRNQVGLGLGYGAENLCKALISLKGKKVYELANIARSDTSATLINTDFNEDSY